MVDKNQKIKMGIISGASHAIRYKEANPRATEDDVVRYIYSNINQILSKIDQGI